MPADLPSPGAAIGPYRILDVLGEGGMGVVYAAEQRQPIFRRVALKVIKVGMDTKEVLARFEAERQALALLDHPGVAKVLDAGATAEGRPYFAMELVRGLPITRYCDQGKLSVHERVELIAQACAALQHAHERGILHRDIKPTNLLVTEIDGKPVVKVIDFGLAKATNQRLTERTLFTEEGRIIGTPEYMSPEQAETSAQDVDARTDVFSLGVVLYELLAGALPFDFQAVRAKGYLEVQRFIREEDPPTPRQRLSGLKNSLADILALRRCRLRELAGSLKNGLDAVTMKAIAKQRRDRYGSCADLAADLERFLAGEAVLARGRGAASAVAARLRRFVRRHPAVVPALGLATLTALVTWWAVRAESSSAGDVAAKQPPPSTTALPPPASRPAPEIVYRELQDQGTLRTTGTLKDGLQTGEWTYLYESGRPRATGRYEADHQVGPWLFWFEDGKVDWEGEFDAEGKRTGEWTFHHPNGAVRARGCYLHDVEDGPWEFFDADGRLERCGQYDAGQLSGFWRYNHPAGTPKAEGVYVSGTRIGTWQVWDEGGRRGEYDYGGEPGIRALIERWPDGSVRRAGALLSELPTGRWATFHQDGGLRFCATLRGRRVNGRFEARDRSGSVLARGMLEDGRFGIGCIAGGSTNPRWISPGPVPEGPKLTRWVTEAEIAGMRPEMVVSAYCLELTSTPSDSSSTLPGPASLPRPATGEVVEAVAQEPERIPAPVQPDWTVGQKQKLPDYVRNYLEAAPAATDGGDPRAAELRASIVDRPLPFDVLSGGDRSEVDLRRFHGRRSVLLVILRGYSGAVDVYCMAQARALVECRADIAAAGAEIVLVYPGPIENLETFTKAYEMAFGEALPLRLCCDPGCVAVGALGIQADLARPTALLVDEDGSVRYACIGDRTHRPAAKDLVRVAATLHR